MHDSSGVTKSRLCWSEIGKSTFRGCLASLGNDGILELFALNAKIFGAELNYCVSRVNPNAATEIWSPRSKIQHRKPSVKFLVTLGGSTGDPFMPSKPHVPNYFPFTIHGLGT